MADKTAFIRLTSDADHSRVRDLMDRAADYVRLETGRAPDDAYVTETLTDRPPQIPADQVHLIGIERRGGTLAGIICALDGYYDAGEWYIGLLLIDPLARGRGLGARAVDHIRRLARKEGGHTLRIAVLEANPAGRRFWAREGFALEKTVPSPPDGDGHTRHVMRHDLNGRTA
ncbi:GNAT superfamily N-acetyltransferase [Rubricella aquisinus]|uniref:GNAT superfamily N-acetyltransferase n=1 Tax=Rubricella aquisinus TaxID=2028108 RepID=A0A840WT79_9RHOB|nr:GNAT family N-acetyltransferase [Rubricella aquisinus]MBB5516882.1 GNAT superfamily N-acetyltransferase [Rubricella aquisinus]